MHRTWGSLGQMRTRLHVTHGEYVTTEYQGEHKGCDWAVILHRATWELAAN